MRVGYGTDTHALAKDRKLILGGVDIPFDMGLDGHSDADVLTHAIMDALLGAAGLGDIGLHFPDTNPKYKDADSLMLLSAVVDKLHGFRICNVDATIVCQRPKLAGHISSMRENIAWRLMVESTRVNIKATTTEHLGYEGRGEGISAQAVCLLEEV